MVGECEVRYGLSIDETVMFKMVNAEGRRYLTDVHSDMDPWRRRRDPYAAGGRSSSRLWLTDPEG
jgi:hypothetical protein